MTCVELPETTPSSDVPTDEHTLIDRVRARDVSAFKELYFRYYGPLNHFLFELTRRPQVVDDLINDSMLVVWEKSHTFRRPSRLSTWIFGIAYRKATEAIRQGRGPVGDGSADQDMGLNPAEAIDPERQRMEWLILQATGELSVAHRAVVECTYFQGMHYREIAKIVKCPVGRVKALMLEARRHLKRRVDSLPEGDSR